MVIFLKSFSKVLIVAAFAICGILCLSCSRKTDAQKAAKAGILIIGNAADPASLDPSFATGFSESRILNALFEGLLSADSKTLSPIPAVAKKWSVSADGKIYDFELDERAMWSDGTQVKAEDFVFAWQRMLNPKLGAEYSSLLFPIKNAKAIKNGKLAPDTLGAKSVSDSLLRVELENPTPQFLNMLSHFAFFPLPKHTLEKFGACASRDATWTKPENIVSNGAFTLSKWRINDLVEVRKNPNFRAKDRIFLNAIRFLPISNVNTEDRAFRAGQLHMTDSVVPSRINSIKRDFPEALKSENWLGVYYYTINTLRPPLDNVKVRKALALSIDRAKIVEKFLRGGQTPAYSFIPDGIDGYKIPKEKKFREDLNEARRLIKEANLSPDTTIRITYNTSEQHKPIAEAIQQMWRENLGVNAVLYNLSWPAYLSARAQGDFDVARASWVADFAAPESFLHVFRSDSALNHGKYRSAKYDMLLDQALKEPKNRMKLSEEAESVLLDDAAIIPIYFYRRVRLVSPMVKGWDSNALDYCNYQGVRLVETSSKDGKVKDD